MNTPLCLARVLLLLVCVGAPSLLSFAQAPVEPSWNGKYLSYYRQQLKDPSSIQRGLAAEAIGNMGSTAAGAVPDLTALLDSKEASDRVAGALALAKIGEASKPALPQLQKMAASQDQYEKKVGQLAIEAIDPPASAMVKDWLSSAYVLSAILALGVGGIVAGVLWFTHKKKQKAEAPGKKAEPSRSPETSTPPSSADAGGTAAQPTAAKPAAAAAGQSAYRKRVSRQLPGLDSYVQEQEGPDAVKRDLQRVSDEFKRLCDRQQELARYYNSEELTKDPERLRALRLENDELAIMHYKSEIRVKALEVKMLEMLVDSGGASDPALRVRTETTIRQKWEDLRKLCETPAKTQWKGEQWVSIATGPQSPIADLRAHLATFDVHIGPRTSEPMEPSAPEEGGEPPAEAAAETSGTEEQAGNPDGETSPEPAGDAGSEAPPASGDS